MPAWAAGAEPLPGSGVPPQHFASLSNTIKSAVDEAAARLSRSPTDTPRLDAEVLMSFVLGWPRARLLAHWDEALPNAEETRFRQLIERRAAGEPVAYVRNLKEFMGLDLYVDPRVLIPRPETEVLVARALAWLAGRQPGLTVADIGTGSGAMAISLISARRDLHVIATDLSTDALDVARLNAARHHVELDLRAGWLLDPLAEPADLVVANLPYVSDQELRELAGTSIDFEPRLALDGGPDGLRCLRDLSIHAPGKLRSAGALLLEIGDRQAEAVRRLAAEHLPGWSVTIHADYAGLPRVAELQRPGRA